MFLTIFLNFWLFLHPFYVSVTEVKENLPKKTIEISLRIFTDDLEKTLKSSQLGIHNLSKPKDRMETEKALNAYIQKHFYLEIDGKKQSMHFIGYEIEEDACWNYLEIQVNSSKIGKVHLHNEILFEAHPEEINLIHYQRGDQKESTKLENPKSDYYPFQSK